MKAGIVRVLAALFLIVGTELIDTLCSITALSVEVLIVLACLFIL